MEFNEFKEYFASFNQSWYFAKPDDTSKLLGDRLCKYKNSFA
jgi:hypothetical protein